MTTPHAARAYAPCYGISEDDALGRIRAGLDAEREEHTTPLSTIQDHGKPN